MRIAVSIIAIAALSVPVAAQDSRFADPAAIDRLVESFTGQPIGASGGARAPVDRRLRLASCTQPLDIDWHGSGSRTVAVSCAGQGGWRIFVQLQQSGAVVSAKPAITRGEAVTITIEGDGFSVQQRGEAMEAGGVGEWIQVRSSAKSASVRGRIERPGLVVIPAG